MLFGRIFHSMDETGNVTSSNRNLIQRPSRKKTYTRESCIAPVARWESVAARLQLRQVGGRLPRNPSLSFSRALLGFRPQGQGCHGITAAVDLRYVRVRPLVRHGLLGGRCDSAID